MINDICNINIIICNKCLFGTPNNIDVKKTWLKNKKVLNHCRNEKTDETKDT